MGTKNVLIFIHGIGKHDTGWSLEGETSPVKFLESELAQYEEFNGSSLGDDVEFEEITYDQTFETIRNQWQELADGLGNTDFDGFSADSRNKIDDVIGADAQTLAGELAKDQFAVTHALDAVMYKSFALIRDIVSHDVAAQLAAIVAKHMSRNQPTGGRPVEPTFSIVAHSLGTAVIYDALQLLSSAKWLEGVPKLAGVAASARRKRPDPVSGDTIETNEPMLASADFDKVRFDSMFTGNPFGGRSRFDWHGLVMISNVSKFMHGRNPGPEAKSSVLKPEWAPMSNGRVLRFYYNVDHALDPTTKIDPFSCKAIWLRSVSQGKAADIDDLVHLYDYNVHGISHYLKNPRVHARIAYLCAPDRVNGYRFVRFADRCVADGRFARFGGQFSDASIRDELEEKLQEILDTSPAGGAENKYKARVEKLADLIPDPDDE